MGFRTRLHSLLPWAALLLAFSGSGCNPTSKNTYVPVERTDNGFTPPKAADPGTEAPGTSPTDRDKTQRVPGVNPKTGRVEPLKIPKGTMTIKPVGSDGYQTAKMTPAELGRKVDEAFADLTNAWADADTILEVGGAQLAGKSNVKIKDAKTFNVEYYDPQTEATLNRVISNGTERVKFYRDSWTKLPTPGSKPVTEADVLAEWPTQFLSDMFRLYSSDERVWSKLMSAIGAGEGGYKATVEEQKAKVLGKERTLYRLVADRATDGTQLEMIIDGVRFLPVTVRTAVKTKDGKTDSRLWTCSWKFGGTFDAKEFTVPKTPGP